MEVPGLIAVAAVLVVGVAAGLWRRSVDGRIRTVTGGPAEARSPAAATESRMPTSGIEARMPAGETESRMPTSGIEARMPAGETEARMPTGGSEARMPAGGTEAGPELPAGRELAGADRIDPGLLSALGVPSGQVTLLQFSSAFCAPCRAVRRISSEVAGMVHGVVHVEVDAESHLDAVRALNIWKTPTLLVVGPDGRIAKRATGVPGKPQLIAALGELL